MATGADPTVLSKRRNVVVLGKCGAGKSTVANNIVGHDVFTVGSSLGSVTEKPSHTEVIATGKDGTQYNFKVIDTVGLFDMQKTNKATINSVKSYFKKRVPEGVNLVLFVFKHGRFTPEEKETFDYIIKNFRKEISGISALVVTSCEDLDEEGREKVKKEFSSNASTTDLASFMGKGIFTVGFPDLKNVKEKYREDYKADAEQDAEVLRELVYECSELRLSQEMFQESFWSKCTIL